jgi:peptide deformylase
MSPIVTVPDPVLRQTTKEVYKADKRLLSLVQDMTKTLLAAHDPEGVGLAAPQIGVSLRVFLVRPEPKKTPLVFINPQILEYSQRLQKPTSKKGIYEGCLSIPHHYAPLSRSMSVTVKYQTLEKNPQTDNYELITKNSVFTGFSAHVIQHEMDHLNGILFIDRVLEQNSHLYHVDGEEWEEIKI